jgi:hypothetical protein
MMDFSLKNRLRLCQVYVCTSLISFYWKFCLTHYIQVEFEVLTAVVMNLAIFWNITPSSPYANRRFEGT